VKYQVIQLRKDRKARQTHNIIWRGNRKNDAIGQQKQLINSSLDMIIHHDYFDAHDFEVDLSKYEVTLFDEYGDIILYIRAQLKEIDDVDQSVP